MLGERGKLQVTNVRKSKSHFCEKRTEKVLETSKKKKIAGIMEKIFFRSKRVWGKGERGICLVGVGVAYEENFEGVWEDDPTVGSVVRTGLEDLDLCVFHGHGFFWWCYRRMGLSFLIFSVWFSRKNVLPPPRWLFLSRLSQVAGSWMHK